MSDGQTIMKEINELRTFVKENYRVLTFESVIAVNKSIDNIERFLTFSVINQYNKIDEKLADVLANMQKIQSAIEKADHATCEEDTTEELHTP